MTVDEVTAWVSANEDMLLDEKLLEHGAILFRGFPLPTSAEFDSFVRAFTRLQNLPYEDSLSFAVRLDVTERVCTTNEGKKGGQVFHHEQAQTPLVPSKLFFYCETPADVGGGTAVCPSDEVLRRVEEKYPEFVAKCEKLGVNYTAVMAASQDASKGVGRSWKSFFGRDTREGVEERMRELGYTWEWLPDEVLRATSPALPAVRTAPNTNRRVFFNQLVAQIANAREFAQRTGAPADDLDKYLTFGDGTGLDQEALACAHAACEETACELNWQPGDVALLDNYLVMHARRQFEGKRRVLASVCK